MSIRNKLLLGFTSVLVFTTVGFLVLYYSLQTIGDSYKNLAEKEVVKLNLAQDIRFEDLMLADAIKGIIIDPQSETQLKLYNEYAEKINNDITSVRKLIKDERAVKIFKEIDDNNQQLIDLESQMMELAGTDREKTLEIHNGDYQEVREIFSRNLEDFEKIQEEIMETEVQDGMQVIEQRSTISIIVIFLSIILSIVISLMISRMITKPLHTVVNRLVELSSNEGDLTARLFINSKDEFGKLSNAFNTMIGNIQQIIKHVQKTTSEVAASSEELYSSSEQNSEATNQITMSIQEIAAGADKQVVSTQESLTALSEITMGIQKVANSSQSVEESTRGTSEKAENGNLVITKTLNQMETIHSTVADAGAKVQELGELSNQVGQIVGVITAIADQTNLLALNAAIEAARAGESGKGFAVVADEVRKLAEQSKDSAAKITTLISSIQLNTSLAVESTNKGINEVNEGIHVVNEASLAFHAILHSIREVANQIQEVAASSQQMTAGAEQVTNIIDELSNISKEASNSSQMVAAASEQQLASMEEIAASAENLSKMSSDLEEVVGKFKV